MQSYYRVNKGPTRTILEAYQKEYAAAVHTWKKWVEGIPGVMGFRTGAVTFGAGAAIPKGWRQVDGDICKPDCRTKAGKALMIEMKQLTSIPGGINLMLHLIGKRDMDIMQVNRTGTPGFLTLSDGTMLLSTDDYWLPHDRSGLVEITAGEFRTAFINAEKEGA